MDVAITGSHGFIASKLIPALKDKGHRVLRLVRTAETEPGSIHWDPEKGRIDAAGLEGIEAVVHLAGEGIGDRRWTDEQKRRILESRTKGTGLLATTLAELQRPPAVMVSASAVGYYGDRGDEVLTEESSPGTGFAADVCVRWEQAAEPAATAGIRVAHPRSGIVLGRTGGALKKMLLPFKLGLGGRLGSGRQWFSWIAIDDEVRVLLHLIERSELTGPVNATAPNPVTNAEFTKTFGRVLGRPTVIPVPTIGLKLVFGSEAVDEGLLTSQRALPARLESDGFEFQTPELEGALRQVLNR
jgi:uncharacterized protein (TIGR01777 family)